MRKICSFLAAAGLLLTLAGGGLAEAKAQTNETGILRAGSIPAIGSFLNMGEQVEVTGKADETHVYVKTEQGTGLVDVQLLRFPDEPFEPWQGTLRSGSKVYAHFSMLGEPETRKESAPASVLEELDACYYVSFGEKTGYVPKSAVTRPATGNEKRQPGAADAPAAPPSTPPTTPPTMPSGQDGEELVLTAAFTPLSRTEKTGLAAAKVDEVPVVLFFFQLGQEVTLLTEPDEDLEQEGYFRIALDDGAAYVPEQWVRTAGEEQDSQQVRYAGANCPLYDSFLLMGRAEKTLKYNSEVTVYSEADGIAYVRCGEDWGFVPADCLNRFAAPAAPAAPDAPATPDAPANPTAPAAPTIPAIPSAPGGTDFPPSSEWSPPVL